MPRITGVSSRKVSKQASCAENTDLDSSDSDSDVFKDVIDHEFNEELKGLPEVLKYINHLLTLINRQQVKLDKVCLKVKKLKKRIRKYKKPTHLTDSATQTDDVQPQSLPLDFLEEASTSTELAKSKQETATLESATVSIQVKDEPDQTIEPSNAWVLGNSTDSGPSLAEQVAQAAQSAMQHTGFVYEPTSGMYFDYNTNYYYNAELGLYYDGNTGTYLYYDEKSQSYIFHSQPEVIQNSAYTVRSDESHIQELNVLCDSTVTGTETRKQMTKKEKRLKFHKVVKTDESPEEGECSDTSCSTENESTEMLSPKSPENVETEVDLTAKVWPPCMRMIVKHTGVEGLKVGTLFIVTCTGGTMGREGDHAVLIPDINISKHHAKFNFDEHEDKYFIVDFGSRNGTYLNLKRLSVAKQESEPSEILHGSTITVGSTSLLCHIHPGIETCGHCEPGLVQKPDNPEEKPIFMLGEKNHKSELMRLRKKFGLVSVEPTVPAEGYEDRAQIRRNLVGSSHDDNEKTLTASVHEAIPEDNKGFKLLQKMGWSKGQALGKDGDGRIDPVSDLICTTLLTLIRSPK